ncbi:peptidoglycan/LPS O-acetylase OafA/YrhL [Actimicrobium sp. GrIS 1.19]|uniref:acyltransferase family protein n=1 Tax=Actimicrobium sp. GrIS 1.19 TaxID=3071708 RepID=UPI002DF9A5F0|nr:peptidoglycan/LPS O-acetylase OafA/YrhL [Actimicrobium sp. GrIS 1.19]
MASLEQTLNRYRGIGPGFDFLRVFLAVCIVFVHAIQLTGYREALMETPGWFLTYALVPMFFALSGFLITASAIRLSLKNFLLNRGLRIVPALAVDVVICALVIGPLLTTYSLGDYFSGASFRVYFLNVFGWIHYSLPGVFTNNHSDQVNGALWTVPYEIMCYVFAAIFIVANWLRSKFKVLALTTVFLLVGGFIHPFGLFAMLPETLQGAADFLLVSKESQILEAFLLGIVAYQWRASIQYSKTAFWGCVALCILAALFPRVASWNISRLVLLPALTYMTVFIGLSAIPIPSYFKKGDYSYGIYLYHDPLMQSVIALFPAIAMGSYAGTAFTFLCGLSMVLLMSNLSWHFVEKPILAMRKRFSFVAKVRDLGDGATRADTGASLPEDVTAAPER